MRLRPEVGKVNVRLLVVLVGAAVVLGAGAFIARDVRRRVLASRDLAAGLAAFDKGDWPTACRRLADYLSRRPEDAVVWGKYARANLSVEPLDPGNVGAAIGAYRKLMKLTPEDLDVYDTLARLYRFTGNNSELAYVAEQKLARSAGDVKATIWQAEARVAQRKFEDARKILLPLEVKLAALKAKDPQYVEVCTLLSQIASQGELAASQAEARKWADRAIQYAPESTKALIFRAKLLRKTETRDEDARKALVAAARKDLERVEALKPASPEVRLLLSEEWMWHGELARSAAVLKSLDDCTREALKETYVDLNDWYMSKFLMAVELSFRQGKTGEQAAAADAILAKLTRADHLLRVLPRAVRVYVAGGRPADARKRLDEYLGLLSKTGAKPEYGDKLAALKAYVAAAENKAYRVIELLEPLVATDPQNASLRRILADAYSRTDQTRQAIRELHAYLRIKPDDPDVVLMLSREYTKVKDWSRAFQTARLAEQHNPAEVAIQLLRMEMSIYLAQDRTAAVRKAQLQALWDELVKLRKDKDRIEVRRLQAYIAFQQERVEDSIKELKAAIKDFKDTLEAELQLARIYFHTDRLSDAIETCRAACEKHPDSDEAWIALAELERIDKKPKEAIATLERGLKTVQGPWEKRSVTLKLAVFQLLEGDRKAGVSLLEGLAAQSPREIRARELLLQLPEIRRDEKAAARLIGDIRTVQGEGGVTWRLHQAELLLSREDWRARQQEIIPLLDKCLESDPGWPAATLMLAWMHERLGKPEQAEQICRKALSANPGAIEVADRLVRLLEQQRRFGEAKEVVDRLEASPEVLSARRLRVAIGSGDFSQAIDELKLRIANEEEQRDAGARILLARLVYWDSRDVALALKYLEEAAKIEGAASTTITSVRVEIARAEALRREAESRKLREEGKIAAADKLTEEAKQQKAQALKELDEQVAKAKSFGAYLMRGSYLANVGEYEAAEKDFRHLTTFKTDGRGYYLLAGFYAAQPKLEVAERIKRAVAALREGIKEYPKDLVLQRSLMKTLLVRGEESDRAEARKILAEQEQRLPNDPDLMATRAEMLIREGTPAALDQALPLLERVVELEPSAVNAHLALIEILRKSRRYTEARERAIRAQGANPASTKLMLARAILEHETNNQSMAATLADMVIEAEPDNADARRVLVQAALVTRDEKMVDKAQTLVGAAIQKKADDAQLYCWSSGLWRLKAALNEANRDESLGQAKKRIDQAIKVAPDNRAVLVEHLSWLGQKKLFDEVAPLIARQKTKDAGAIDLAATILGNSTVQKDRRKALDLFAELAAMAPKSVVPLVKRAMLAYEMKEMALAEQQYREALVLNADLPVALNGLAWILQETRKDYKSALKLADKGVQLAPKDPYLRDTRGVILMRLGRLEDARRDFQKLLDLTPADSTPRAKALLQLGRVCAQIGDTAQSRVYLQEALQIGGRDKAALTQDERTEIRDLLVTIAKKG